jgi:demethylmenaquinone methyltransferase / 2-methoxy-6-polyprenyl-1,4-benzoquinol methylase
MDVTESRTKPNVFARTLFRGLPRRYNALARLLSLGQDPKWRAEMVRHVVDPMPRLVLDVACGPCAVTCKLAASLPDAAIVGLDLSSDMLAEGVKNVARAGIADRVALTLGRGEQLPFADGEFDAVTFTYLLRYVADPASAIQELARVLRPGAPIASLEFAVPPRRAWRAAWVLYTRVVLPVAGLLTGGPSWFQVGRFLGPSISSHYRSYPVEWTLEAWRRAGIEQVQCRSMSLGGGLVIWGVKRA